MKFAAGILLPLLCAATALAQDKPAMPAAGTAAPTFQLQSQEGKPVRLESFHGKWVVLYFYPKDYTSGCTVEAHNFQRDLSQFEKRKAVVLGVSLDNVDSHKGFCTKEGLHFKLLADPDHVVTDKYGVLMNHEGMNYASRTTFLIDPKGVIRKVYEKVNPAEHSTQVLADLDQLRAAK